MATIALAAGGSSIGATLFPSLVAAQGATGLAAIGVGQVFGFLGATAGSYIDAAYTIPAIFGNPSAPNAQGPRVTDIDLSLATEGSGIPWSIGPDNRVPAVVLYAGNFVEERTETSSGGKGGGGGTTTVTFTYFVDVLLAVNDGEITDVTKLLGDGKKILEKRRKFQRLSNQVSAAKRKNWMLVDIQNHSLKQLLVGSNVQFAGFNNAANNGFFKVYATKRVSEDPLIWRVRVLNPDAVDEAAGASVWIVQAGALKGAGRADDIEVFPGTTTQGKWSVLEADKGTSKVPAYRGTALIGIQKLALNDFGERMPNFTAEVNVADPTTIQEALTKVMLEAGFDAEDFDVTRVRGNHRGFHTQGFVNSVSRLQPLMNAYQLRVRESNGVFVFFEKGDEDTVPVRAGDLLLRKPRFKISHGDTRNLPSVLGIRYIDVNNKMEPGLHTYQNPMAVTFNPDTVEVPVVLDGGQARKLARDTMWERWNRTKEPQFVLPPSYMDVEESDILPISFNGETFNVQVIEITRGANYEHEITGVIIEDSAIDKTDCFEDDEPDVSPEEPIPQPRDLALVVMDIPAIEPDRVDQSGFYLAVSPFDDEGAFRGAGIYQSSDPADVFPWNLRATAETYPTMGEAVTAIGPAPIAGRLPAVPAAWDDSTSYVSRPTVDIYRGALVSKTEQQVLDGENNALLGNEIIGFQEAELIAPGRYKLKKLLRGLRNTRWAMDKHVAGERFVMLNKTGLIWVDKHRGAIGQAKWFKAVDSGGLVADFDQAIDYQTDTGLFQSNTLRPFAPANVIRATGTNDVITWEFVTRQFTSALAEGAPPLDEEEQYEIDVFDDADHDTVLWTYKSLNPTAGRSSVITINGDGTSSFTYLAADKTADGWSNLYARVYQVHQNFGRGNYEEIY